MIKEIRELIVDILQDMEDEGLIEWDLNLNKLEEHDLKRLHDNYIADGGFDVHTWIMMVNPELELAYKQFLLQ